MLLIVAEKPNQAEDIARAVLGQVTRGANCFVGRDVLSGQKAIVAFCAGHLLEMWMPEEYDPKWASWTFDSLPVAPPKMLFKFRPRDNDARALLSTLERAMHDASEIVNACDAGREGELIFWETLRFVMGEPRGKCISRMWIQDPTPKGLLKAFEGRKSANSERLGHIRDAALLRQQADWLYGCNMSRYVTLAVPPPSHMHLQNQRHAVGRVQTPVLGLIYDKHYQVQSFEAQPFFRIRVTFVGDGAAFHAQLLAEEDEAFHRQNTQWKDYETVKEVVSALKYCSDDWVAVDETPEKEEYPPEPFSLVELQRTCWRVFGWSSKYTLRVAQHCYAREKTITYPRTESFHMPLSTRSAMVSLRHALWSNYILKAYPAAARVPPFELGERYFRKDEAMEEHHAIIPTGVIPNRLDERGNVSHAFLLWDLVVRRFVTALLPPAIIQASSRILEWNAGARIYRALLKAAPLKEPNWLLTEDAVGNTRGYGMSLTEREAQVFPECGPVAQLIRAEFTKSYTEMPERYTDDTLLGNMLRLKLGTAATRAEMIEKLIARGYVERTASGDLIPRLLGEHLVQELNRLDAKDLLSPEVTRSWEAAFDEIETGKAKYAGPEKFLTSLMAQIVEMGTRLHQRGSINDSTVYCPRSHEPVAEERDYFVFPGFKNISFPKIFCGRPMTAREWRAIVIANPKVGGGPFQGFRGKKGEFAASVVFSARKTKFKQHFSFKFSREKPAD